MLHECWWMFLYALLFMFAKRLDVWIGLGLMNESCNFPRGRRLGIETKGLTNLHAYVNL
jgi:hypothetical protein